MVHSLTTGQELDPIDAVNAQERPAPPGRPYVLTNMVASMDGAIAIDGVSGGLGGSADFRVFMALRSTADAIVAGAGTVRDEQYKVPDPSDRVRALRIRSGRPERPLIAIVTRSGRLAPDLPVFADPGYRPLVVHGTAADADAISALEGVADLVAVDGDEVAPPDVLAALRSRGCGTVLLEGGPTLNGAFIAADCIDEWNLTLSPNLVGGKSGRAANGPHAAKHPFTPLHVWAEGDFLFIQWRRNDRG